MGRYTSLRRDSVSQMNYQSNYLGTLECVIDDFTHDCKFTKATWGYLYDESTGDCVHVYRDTNSTNSDVSTTIDVNSLDKYAESIPPASVSMESIIDILHNTCKPSKFFRYHLNKETISIRIPQPNGNSIRIAEVPITWGTIMHREFLSDQDIARQIDASIAKWIDERTSYGGNQRIWSIRLFNVCSNMGVVACNLTFPEAQTQFASMSNHYIQSGHNFGLCYIDDNGIEFGHLWWDGHKG